MHGDMNSRKILRCRICKSKRLDSVIDLGRQHLQGLFIKLKTASPPKQKFPLKLVRCTACGFLQLSHTISPKILYSFYWYRSGVNKTMRQHLKKIAVKAAKMMGKKKTLALDIGCNDGTLLSFYPSSFIKVGIDPSNATSSIDKKITLIKDIFPSYKINQWLDKKKFDIITSIAMFYDVDQPVNFAKQIKKILKNDGLWIFEVYYMPYMLKLGCYDLICHEHISYFSLTVLKSILKSAGMKIIKVETNDINGQSIQCFTTHMENHLYDKYEETGSINKILSNEKTLNLDSKKTYLHFKNQILNHRLKLITLLKKLKGAGKTIHLYGASTKGNTLLQFCKIDNSIIDFAADRNPQKYGAFTPGTSIPIVSEEESRKMNPDYYLVMPWAFRREFLKREEKMLERGVGMIFPFPKIEVVKKRL